MIRASRRMLLWAGLALLLGLSLAGPSTADLLVPKRGKKVHGAIVRDTEAEVVLNLYGSRNPGVTNPEHLVKLARSDVKRVELLPRPEVEVWRRMKACKAGEADAFVEVARYALEEKQKAAARVAFAYALKTQPDHAEALKGIGGKSKWQKARRGNVLLDDDLATRVAAYAAESDVAVRKVEGPKLLAAGIAAKPCELERYRRSALQKKGYQQDRPLTYRADQHPGAVYTLQVPNDYDPSRPWPLLIGLHGGGQGGKAGDEVVGSGPSAMNFYRRLGPQYGFIVACPTAQQAPWPTKANEAYLRDLITELRLLYHIDVDRIHLTGHSMGGFGSWGLGPRLAEDLASLSPMAGGGGTLGPLLDTKTPIFIFHGADDRVVGPSSDRQQAKALLGSGHDFIYTELPNSGHGFPGTVQKELFDFCQPRRRIVKRRKSAWPVSSFRGKVTKEEIRYFGSPLAEWNDKAPDLSTMLDRLEMGGGAALAAVSWILEHKPEGASAAVAKRVADGRLPPGARAYAARALASLADQTTRPALQKGVVVAAARAHDLLVREAAAALGALGHAESGPALERALSQWSEWYAGKRNGDQMAFADWTRGTRVLVSLVEAWGQCAPEEADPRILERAIIAPVFEATLEVRTSPRVPQDPSRLRRALARALGSAYQACAASESHWTRLLSALDSDAGVRAAAEGARK